jgi:hypothetical protein
MIVKHLIIFAILSTIRSSMACKCLKFLPRRENPIACDYCETYLSLILLPFPQNISKYMIAS